jgi:hypothetical protein
MRRRAGCRPPPALDPREGERRAVAATALDELPDRLAGQRPEGFGAEFPGKDEQQQAARRPGEDEQTEGALEPPRERSEWIGCQRGRGDADGRGVAGPVLGPP